MHCPADYSEDRAGVLVVPGEGRLIYVADGHGGHEVVDLFARLLRGCFSAALEQEKHEKHGGSCDFQRVLRTTFDALADSINGADGGVADVMGCCVVVAFVDDAGRGLHVAATGDSAYMVRIHTATATASTYTHDWTMHLPVVEVRAGRLRADEVRRGRLGGRAMSRAFGDREVPGLIHEPDVRSFDVAGCAFELVLFTDGVYSDLVVAYEMQELVQPGEIRVLEKMRMALQRSLVRLLDEHAGAPLEELARAVVDLAPSRLDDATAVCVRAGP